MKSWESLKIQDKTLKPCPRCKGVAHLEYREDWTAIMMSYSPVCSCGLKGPSFNSVLQDETECRRIKQDAIFWWNERA